MVFKELEEKQNMGRRKGSKNKPKINGADEHREEPQAEASPGVGHNAITVADLSEDDRQVLFFQGKRRYKDALEIKKAGAAAFMRVCKSLKAEQGAHVIANIKTSIELETPEGETAFCERRDREIEIAVWMGMPKGTQGSMFDEVDRTPSVDRAFGEGKRAGFEGAIAKPPHDPSVPQYDAWMRGHSEGQAALMRANLRPLSDNAELSMEGPDGPLTEEIARQTFGTEPATYFGTELPTAEE
jgi:hypothetical protein